MSYTSRETYERIAQETNDPIVQWKTCRISGQPFAITQKDLEFYDKLSPTINGVKHSVPTPSLCPEERERRRYAFRNEKRIYRRKCDFSGKEIISIYSPDKPFKVYDPNIRWSDQRNPLDYGRDYDFSTSFTENFRALELEVPFCSQFNSEGTNSVYCNHVMGMKNCYLVYASRECQDSMYASRINNVAFGVDILDASWLEHCYQCVNCDKCFGGNYLLDCSSCSLSHYLINCRGCSNCYLCTGLINQQYCYLNKQYTKAEYEQILSSLPQTLLQGREGFTHAGINIAEHRDAMMVNTEYCFGHKIIDSQYCIGRNIERGQYCKYVDNAIDLSDTYDGLWTGAHQSLAYEMIDSGINSFRDIACLVVHHAVEMYYSISCYHCSNCLGCIGLRNKEYCIFNKQYTKAEYETLLSKIICSMQERWEWGEFFDPSLSPFGYNETVAIDFYPCSAEQVRQEGFVWSDYEAPQPFSEKPLQAADLPARIEEVSDDILKAVIACEVTGRLFRIESRELEFYRKHHLPLPRRHPDQRHLERTILKVPKDTY